MCDDIHHNTRCLYFNAKHQEWHSYLTPHISFADFKSQKFGKVLSQLCDTWIQILSWNTLN